MFKLNIGSKMLLTTGVLFLSVATVQAVQVVVYQESFDGAGDGFTSVGQGNAGNIDFWELVPIPGTLNLGYTPTGHDGTVFGARDLNSNFGGQSGTSAIRRLETTPVSVAGLTNVMVDISLSARGGNRFETNDFVRLLIDEGTGFVEVDRFDGGFGTASSPLTSSTSGALGATFTTYTYNVSPATTNVSFAIVAINEGNNEVFAFDDIVIRGDLASTTSGAAVPEPLTATLGMMGLAAMGYTTHRRRNV